MIISFRFNNNNRHSPLSVEHRAQGEGFNGAKPAPCHTLGPSSAPGWPRAGEGEGPSRTGERTANGRRSYRTMFTTRKCLASRIKL